MPEKNIFGFCQAKTANKGKIDSRDHIILKREVYMFPINRTDLLTEARRLLPDMVQFLKDLISIPGESGQEEKVIKRILQEMEKVGFDDIEIDNMGNIIGRVGKGKTHILMDAHIDTVGPGDLSEWPHDPFNAREQNGIIYGRGASDQLAGMVSLVYALPLMKKFDLFGDFTLSICGTCHEEACEGLPLYHIINNANFVKPDFVLLSEPTNLRIARGHRGRMEIKIITKGKSAHASVPPLGINAIYKMLPLINEIENLNCKLKDDPFLGKGTIAVTKIDCDTPALCAIPNRCTIYIDRRLTAGETKETALAELQQIINSFPALHDTELEILHYEARAWTGEHVQMEKYFPGWVLDENHPLTVVAAHVAEYILETPPVIGRWDFSTNGIATMGDMGIPTIGFGPADDKYAHTIEDQVPIEHLIYAAMFYALFPATLTQR
jgi:putative selenium metabolism hydrolase